MIYTDPEAKRLIQLYGKNLKGLANHLTQICLHKPKLVLDVFLELNYYRTLNTVIYFIAKINPATFHFLVKTRAGFILCLNLDNWTKHIDAKYTESQIGLQYGLFIKVDFDKHKRILKSIISSSKRPTNKTSSPKKLSSAEINSYKKIAKKQGNNFDESIVWELPEKGTGFTVYNRDDTKEGLDQIGTKEAVENIIALGQKWHQKYPNRPLQIGDLSRPGGIRTKEHGTHRSGKIFDMRPLRNDSMSGDNARVNIWSPSYSRKLTEEFILLVNKHYPGTKILFDDPQIYRKYSYVSKAKPKYSRRLKKMVASHADHLHIRFPGGD